MELKEFISSTLVEIAEGVKEAQKRYEELGGVVNPSNISIDKGLCSPGGNAHGFIDRNYNLSNIEFEVTLAENIDSENKAGIGVLLSQIGIGASTKEQHLSASMNKVRFNVQVKFPTTKLTV